MWPNGGTLVKEGRRPPAWQGRVVLVRLGSAVVEYRCGPGRRARPGLHCAGLSGLRSPHACRTHTRPLRVSSHSVGIAPASSPIVVSLLLVLVLNVARASRPWLELEDEDDEDDRTPLPHLAANRGHTPTLPLA